MDFLTRKLAGYVLCADNTTLSSGSGGDTIATDDIGGVKFPRSKIVIGADGTNDGDVSSANPLPITHAALTELAAAIDTEVQVDVVTSALPSGAATSARQDTGNTSLSSIDGKITAVNTGAVVVSSSALPSGASTAAKQPALGTAGTASADVISVQGIASMTPLQVADNGGTLSIDDGGGNISIDDGGNTITVDGTVTANLAAGTNNIGDVDVLSIAAGDNNIGNVDIVTVPAPLSTTGGGTEATALRVTVASDSTGVLSVDDNGGALTVDNAGTFATQATLTPATSGGLDTFKSTDIDETEEDVKTSAGLLYWIYCVNTNASARYLKVYNATAANVTVGSTATKLDLLIPPSNSGFFIQFPHGITFSTAISVAATTGVGDSDSGAPGANEVQVTVGYK